MERMEPPGLQNVRRRVLTEQIRQLDPDVIAIQEANPLPAFIDTLARDLRMDAVAHVGLAGVRIGRLGIPANLRQGDAILARRGLQLRFIARRRLTGGYCGNTLSLNWTDASQVLGASIVRDGRTLCLFATHWVSSPYLEFIEALGATPASHGFSERQIRYGHALSARRAWQRDQSAQTSISFIDRIAAQVPAVFMGDFNTESHLPEIQYLQTVGRFSDSHGRATPDMAARSSWDPARNQNQIVCYSGDYLPTRSGRREDFYYWAFQEFNRQPRRIDFVFTRGGVSAWGYRIVLEEPIGGVHASDHFGVLAEVEFDSAGSPGSGTMESGR